MFGKMTLSCTHAEVFRLSHAYAKHAVNLFHVLKKGIPRTLNQVYHLVSARCEEKGVWCHCQSVSGPDMSSRSGRMRIRRRQYVMLVVLRHEKGIYQGTPSPSISRFSKHRTRVCLSTHSGQSLCPMFAFAEDSLCPLKVCRASVTKRGVIGCCERTGEAQPALEQRKHHLHSSGSLMWQALWRTDTLLLFTVPGALQGILGPEGKPMPGFMRGMSPPQMPSSVWAFHT